MHPWDESCSFNLIPVGFAEVKVCSAEPCLKAVGVMTCGKEIVIKQLGLLCTKLSICINSELHGAIFVHAPLRCGYRLVQ